MKVKNKCRKISCVRCTFEERLLAHQSLMCGEIETGQSAERLLMPPIVRNTLEKYSSEIHIKMNIRNKVEIYNKLKSL